MLQLNTCSTFELPLVGLTGAYKKFKHCLYLGTHFTVVVVVVVEEEVVVVVVVVVVNVTVEVHILVVKKMILVIFDSTFDHED
ncbi:hypothetical protein ElyMa_005990400 [Elysia marginata]|uniref:Transmembrane protein n=1 Tax=Elysia marginata TaxID=1093978 RepID=A0AAV4GFV4_9GAST|nr:hypothetical protein ElyMa_005990400 [Elysia marginata]